MIAFLQCNQREKNCFWHFWDSGFACVHSWQEQYPDGWKKGVYWAQCVSLMKCLTRGNHTCMKLEKPYMLLFNSRKNCRIVFFFPQKKAPKNFPKTLFLYVVSEFISSRFNFISHQFGRFLFLSLFELT